MTLRRGDKGSPDKNSRYGSSHTPGSTTDVSANDSRFTDQTGRSITSQLERNGCSHAPWRGVELPGSTMMLWQTVWSPGSGLRTCRLGGALPALVKPEDSDLEPEDLSSSCGDSDAGVVSEAESSGWDDDFDGGVLASRPGSDVPLPPHRQLQPLASWQPDSPQCIGAVEAGISAFHAGRQPAWRFIGGEPTDLNFSPTLPGAGRALTVALRQLNESCPGFSLVGGHVVFSDFWTEHTIDHGNIVGRRAFIVLHRCAVRRFPESHIATILESMARRSSQAQIPKSIVRAAVDRSTVCGVSRLRSARRVGRVAATKQRQLWCGRPPPGFEVRRLTTDGRPCVRSARDA